MPPPVLDPGTTFLIQITTASAFKSKEAVIRTITCAIEACVQVKLRPEILVVTDDARDVELGLEAETIVTPSSYFTNAVRKARAMQYAIETLERKYVDLTKVWILHLDEESVISSQTLEACLTWIKNGKGVMAQGPIFYSTSKDTSAIMKVTDSIRSVDCYRDADLLLTNKSPSLHGSNILVRADAELQIGWTHAKTLAEDQLFGYVAHELYPKQLGWHGGIIVESSPYTIAAHNKQRKRWVVGTLQNVSLMDTRTKFITLYKLLVWNIGFLGAAAAIPLWVVTFAYIPSNLGLPFINTHATWLPSPPFLTGGQLVYDVLDGDIMNYVQNGQVLPIAFGVLASASLLTWIGIYLLGFYLNKIYATPGQSLKETAKEFGIVASTFWFIGLFENLPSLSGVIAFLRRRADWEVTPKVRQ